MKLKAMGRHLLIRMDHDSIENESAGGIILPEEVTAKEKGGCQVATILDVGLTAFDDQPDVYGKLAAGDKIVTGRYPGQALDLDQNWSDEKASQYRVILDTEVRAVVSEEGAEIV